MLHHRADTASSHRDLDPGTLEEHTVPISTLAGSSYAHPQAHTPGHERRPLPSTNRMHQSCRCGYTTRPLPHPTLPWGRSAAGKHRPRT